MKGGGVQRLRLCAFGFRSVCDLNLAVVIAMTVVLMVKVSVNYIIHMIAVWNCLMATVVAVLVFGTMGSAVVTPGAVTRIRGADLEFVLVKMAFMKRVQVAIVKIVSMPVVEDRYVTTGRSMLMRVVLMNFVLI